MYYLANYNEKQKIHRGEQTTAFPSWQLTDGLEPGNGYFKRVWEFPWLPLQINHLPADLFIGCPAAGFDPGGGNHPKRRGEEWTRALRLAMTPTCSPGGKSPGFPCSWSSWMLAGGTGRVPKQRVCARSEAGELGWNAPEHSPECVKKIIV